MRALVLGLALALAVAAPAQAAPEDVANRISGKIMSPYCPGVTLHDCPSRQADALRERIRERAAQGFSEEQIMDELVAQYGESIRAVPPADRGGVLVWALPGIFLLAGSALAGTLAVRWTRQREQERAAEELEVRRSLREVTPEQRQRLAAELDAHRSRIAGRPEASG